MSVSNNLHLFVLLFFEAHRDFNDITSDHVVASKLRKLYGKVDHIDLWVGGLAEDHVPGAELGPTFLKIFMESMLRVRDGDRYWYENHLSQKVGRFFILLMHCKN